jgi:hypothetical protein
MTNNELWTDSDTTNWQQPKRKFSALHLSMLFATAVIAGAVVMTPILAGHTNANIAANDGVNYDNVITGSIGTVSNGEQRSPDFSKKQYTIRHSITQSSGEPCVIYDIDPLADNCK